MMADNGRVAELQETGFLDLHGTEVHAFSMEIANVGYHRLAELLLAMLRSGAWRSYRDGQGEYRFLPGEFDYFLTQRGIRREDVMKISDWDVKAEIEAAMDERRTGEEGYRRRIVQARAENPQAAGRPIEPYGRTAAEAKALVKVTGGGTAGKREALGDYLRRYTNTERETARKPNESLPPVERIRRRAMGLGDDDLGDLIESLQQEQRRRRRRGAAKD